MGEPAVHPRVQHVVAAFEARTLHAARSGREAMSALASVVADSSAATLDTLAAELATNIEALLRAAPAYAPPLNVIHQMRSSLARAQRCGHPLAVFRAAVAEAELSYHQWADRANADIAEVVSNVIADSATVFTFTLSETVLRALRLAHQRRLRFKVVLTESRPNADGCLTARALAEEGVDVEIGIDGGVGELIPYCDIMLVGAEALLSDGSAICKVGTYPSALVAKRTGVPVYVLADSYKVYPASPSASAPALDSVSRSDVLGVAAGGRASVCGHLFDRTPPELIAAVISERGMLPAALACRSIVEVTVSDFVRSSLEGGAPAGPPQDVGRW
jgi:translation initiation factor 2B subunit (eIF-2B alpha/beta/delta family)